MLDPSLYKYKCTMMSKKNMSVAKAPAIEFNLKISMAPLKIFLFISLTLYIFSVNYDYGINFISIIRLAKPHIMDKPPIEEMKTIRPIALMGANPSGVEDSNIDRFDY